MPTKNEKPKKRRILSGSELMPDGENERRILLSRSDRLSKKNAAEQELKEEISYISFRLGKNERYGISYEVAKEVIHNIVLTKLPNVPNFIAGIINWRGTLITILDLKNYFNLSTTPYDDEFSIIVIESHGITTGVLTDYIDGSDSYRQSMLDPPFPTGISIKPEYIHGLHKGLIAIIDVNTILSEVKSHFITGVR